MTSAQRTQFIAMAVVVTIAFAGLLFMSKQIASTTKTGANGGGAQIEHPKDTFMSSCQEGTLGSVDCNCLTARLESAGYNSDDQWSSLIAAVGNASASPQSAALPAAYSQAYSACRV